MKHVPLSVISFPGIQNIYIMVDKFSNTSLALVSLAANNTDILSKIINDYQYILILSLCRYEWSYMIHMLNLKRPATSWYRMQISLEPSSWGL